MRNDRMLTRKEAKKVVRAYHVARASSPFEGPNYTDVKQIFDEQ
jgi:hypothetical protein